MPLAIAVAAAAGMFSLLLSWYYQPYFAAGNQNLDLDQVTPFFLSPDNLLQQFCPAGPPVAVGQAASRRR